jgi:hypothetical protein
MSRRPIQYYWVIIMSIKKIINTYKGEEKKEKIREYILKITGLKTSGYIYCMHNEYYDVLGERFYKLGNTNNMEARLNVYRINYIGECKIEREIKVPHKLLYELLIMCNLTRYRVEFGREFFINYEEIDKEFTKMESRIKEDSYEKTIDNYIDEIIENKSLKMIYNNNRDKEEIYKNFTVELKKCKKNMNDLKVVKCNKHIINDAKENAGYIINIEYESFSSYYNNEIEIIIQQKNKNINSRNTNYIDTPKIKSILKVRYLDLAKYIINDIIGNQMIKKNIYKIDNTNTNTLLKILNSYFNNNKSKEEIYESYKNDRYNTENKIEKINLNENAYYNKFVKKCPDLLKNNRDSIIEILEDYKDDIGKIKKRKGIFIDTSI